MSPYSVRTSVTLPSIGLTAGAWAYKSGVRKAYTMVSDFAPGKDAEVSFQEAFKKAGGEIVGSVRMALANPDFSAYVQRAKDLNPESIFVFVPAGAHAASWDGRTSRGTLAAPGVYQAVVTFAGESRVRRFVRLR